MIAVRFLAVVVLLNVVRYLFAFLPLEGLIVQPMWGVMERHPEVFNNAFTTADWMTSYLYNFFLWFACALMYHIAAPRLKGHKVIRAFKSYGIAFLFFASISGVYANHYSVGRDLYLWSVLDALLVMPVVAVTNVYLSALIIGADVSSTRVC